MKLKCLYFLKKTNSISGIIKIAVATFCFDFTPNKKIITKKINLRPLQAIVELL